MIIDNYVRRVIRNIIIIDIIILVNTKKISTNKLPLNSEDIITEKFIVMGRFNVYFLFPLVFLL